MASIDFDPEDYVDEIATRYLIKELKKRKILPDVFNENGSDKLAIAVSSCSKTPKRDAIIDFLNLHQSATLEDIQEAVKEIYNK